MKIKSLEIKGFKSFPDRIVFELKPGITTIVGPNGCGKSNVLEAIRWVMGEQRARTLRGKKMEDVIFNGSETRKPVGLAEVRLVLSNDDGLSPASMADYDEIMITRRLFRDGESQYEINNVVCRLADVTDFFLDTGVGRNSYAIIEQGRVDQVIASRPEDRRVLIEEAAGINRYKARRETALKKLEQTKLNLERIHDVIAEVKRQSSSLRRQASRAEKFRKLNDRLKELDLALHAHRCAALQTQWTDVSTELDNKRASLLDRESGFAGMSADLERNRLQALETEKALKGILEDRHKTDVELASLRGAIERDRSRIVQLNDRRNRSREERGLLDTKLEETRRRLLELQDERASLQTRLDAAREELAQAASQSQTAERSLGETRKRLDELKEKLFRKLQDAAQERNRRESLTRRRTEIENHLKKINGESRGLGEALASETEQKEALTATVEEIVRSKKQASEKKTELAGNRRLAAQKINSLRSEISRAEKQLAAHQARMESLDEMQRTYSGYDQSVRFLMGGSSPEGGPTLLGPVAEMLEVPPEYQPALAAVLGERLGHLVVEATEDGVEAVRRLKESRAGRSTLIPRAPTYEPTPSPERLPQGLVRLSDVVSMRQGFQEMGEFLLGGFFVARDLDHALEIRECAGGRLDLVTLEGEIVTRYGEVSGGSRDKKQEGVFQKRREISELKEVIESSEQGLAQLHAALRHEESVLEAISVEGEETERLVNELSIKEVRLRKDLERLEAQMAGSRRRLHVMDLERERLAKEQDGIAADFTRSEEGLSLLEKQRSELELEKGRTSAGLEELNSIVQDKSSQTGEMRVKLAQMEERGRSMERELNNTRDNLAQLEKRHSDLTREADESAREEERLEAQLLQYGGRETELMKEHETLGIRIAALRQESETLSTVLKSLEDQTGQAAKVVRDLQEQIHRLEMESVRFEQILEGLVEKILERYQTDPRILSCPPSAPDETEISELKEKLESMGEVNLAAISESRHVEERLTFLTEQEEDLRKALESLYATIAAINRTTRQRFKEAFESVNEKFQEIFPFLFGGGEARLMLTDEEDLLETGVDILARPPGKRIQNMDLLSGGEKALTAVALIFAIFLTRPSPFCLLDEVDAPLDDANLTRFNEMLRKLSDRTQFLVITHNKRTMEEADSLYGVTMEEAGSSAVVSVRMAG